MKCLSKTVNSLYVVLNLFKVNNKNNIMESTKSCFSKVTEFQPAVLLKGLFERYYGLFIGNFHQTLTGNWLLLSTWFGFSLLNHFSLVLRFIQKLVI